jgi:predicted ArsR family transcriptional regulator
MTDKLPSLDPILHQPVRTQIMAFLSGRGDTSFTDLKRSLELTDGNLGAHLSKLVEAGLVDSADARTGNRSQTLFCLTAAGRTALGHYVAHLEALMKMVTPKGSKAAAANPQLRTRTR